MALEADRRLETDFHQTGNRNNGADFGVAGTVTWQSGKIPRMRGGCVASLQGWTPSCGKNFHAPELQGIGRLLHYKGPH